jgi:uncharacterized protein (TIRG00374 family)
MPSRRHRVLQAAVAVAILAVSGPVLVDAYGQVGRSLALAPGWLVAIAFAEASQLVATWYMLRILLRTTRWFDVAASQLAGDAASNLVPGASLAGAGLQLTMLVRAGFPTTRVTTSLGAVAILGSVPVFIVLPLAAVVATVAGTPLEPRLVGATVLGAVVLAALLVTVVAMARLDRPWLLLASAITAVRRLLRRPDRADLARRLLGERDQLGEVMRQRAVTLLVVALGRTLADSLALYLAIRAVGVAISPATTLAVFIVGEVAGRIPLTPGGLGFVEAGLAGALRLAGLPSGAALVALVTYRLAATWIPSAAGVVAYVLFERRQSERAGIGQPTEGVLPAGPG